MKEFKHKATPEEICAGERCHCILKLCSEAYSYSYDEMPRYGILKCLLENELIKLSVIPDKNYSFMQVNSFIGRICD